MNPQLLMIQARMNLILAQNLKGNKLHNAVTYLKLTRHKSKDKEIKQYCTKKIAELTK